MNDPNVPTDTVIDTASMYASTANGIAVEAYTDAIHRIIEKAVTVVADQRHSLVFTVF